MPFEVEISSRELMITTSTTTIFSLGDSDSLVWSDAWLLSDDDELDSDEDPNGLEPELESPNGDCANCNGIFRGASATGLRKLAF